MGSKTKSLGSKTKSLGSPMKRLGSAIKSLGFENLESIRSIIRSIYKMYILQTKFFEKCQIKIIKNLESGLNCPVFIFGPIDIMVIDKTDSLDKVLEGRKVGR